MIGAKGCVVLGDPNFYSKFGFKIVAELILANVPTEYFQALSFDVKIPKGTVTYHDTFNSTS
jgi:putative acetyltransferase